MLDSSAAKSFSVGVPVAAGVAQEWQFGTNTVTDFRKSVWLDEGAEKNGAGKRTELFVHSTGVLDLGGHDQATGVICAKGDATGGMVTSSEPATLHLVDSYTVDSYDSWVKDSSGHALLTAKDS